MDISWNLTRIHCSHPISGLAEAGILVLTRTGSIFIPYCISYVMDSKFGRGFFVNLSLINRHFALPPEQAWFGAADHLDEMVLPVSFKGTEVERLVESLRKRIIWHVPGTMDKEDAREVTRILNRLAVEIDRNLGIKDAELGEFH
jgi:hypothetical protein